jgi:uncharacterized secreted protein with C-terminal beta-propeller domain
MARNFTKYPKRYVRASLDTTDYKRLEKEISTNLWNTICETIEGIELGEVAKFDLKKFYRDDSNSRVTQILRDMDKLSDDVASYIVDRIIDEE